MKGRVMGFFTEYFGVWVWCALAAVIAVWCHGYYCGGWSERHKAVSLGLAEWSAHSTGAPEFDWRGYLPEQLDYQHRLAERRWDEICELKRERDELREARDAARNLSSELRTERDTLKQQCADMYLTQQGNQDAS